MSKNLLAAGIAVFLSGGVFTAVTAEIWPGRDYPVWAQRVGGGIFLAGLLTLGITALVTWRSKP